VVPSIAFSGLDQPIDFIFGEIFPRACINCYILYRGSLVVELPISMKIVISPNQLLHIYREV
jgi:hypothetical protein